MESLLKWAIENGATVDADSLTSPKESLDAGVLDAILGKPASVQMTECLDSVEHPSTPLEARQIALDDLEMLVEHIDNASNLEPLGLWPRLKRLFGDPEPSIRSASLWVSGTALQHNPKAQQAFSNHQMLAEVQKIMESSDESQKVRTKALYCLSTYVRANAKGLGEWVANKGLEGLLKALKDGSEQLRQKAYFMLGALADEALDTETPEDLRPGMSLPRAMVELGYIQAAVAYLGTQDEAETAETAEAAAKDQAVGFLDKLYQTDVGRQAMLQMQELDPDLKAKLT